MTVSKAAENRRRESLRTESEVRLQLAAPDRPCLAHGITLTDDDLLAKLAECGIKLNRERLSKLVKQFPSAESMTHWILKEDHVTEITAENEDWCWISLTVLWARWFPEHPNFERLDDWIQTGLIVQARLGTNAACAIWMRAWQSINVLLEAFRFDSIEDFDDCFAGTTGIEAWIPTFISALGRASKDGVEWAALRMAVSEQALRLHEDLHHRCPELMTQLRIALAEAHFALGNIVEAEKCFAEAAAHASKPELCYLACAQAFVAKTAWRQLTKGEVSARRGLKLARPGERAAYLQILIDICRSAERMEEVGAFEQQLALDSALRSSVETAARAA